MAVLFPQAQKKWRSSRARQQWKIMQGKLRQAVNTSWRLWRERRIEYDVAACMIFKNAARYLPEWVEFHLMVGVEHFYLYNNNSSDDFQAALNPYIQAGVVTLTQWPSDPPFPASPLHCVKNFGHLARWIAFLDDDEFLFPTSGGKLGDILTAYGTHPAVAVHWVMFGSNGHKRRPEGPVISNYRRTEGRVNSTVKSIVNPRRIKEMASPPSPHYWIYKEDFFRNQSWAVNERCQKVAATITKVAPCADVLRINHYWSKSYQDGVAKLARGWQDNWSNVNTSRVIEHWLEMDRGLNREVDTLILRYGEELRARLVQRSTCSFRREL